MPGMSNLAGQVPGDGPDEYSTWPSKLWVGRGVNTPPCKRSIVHVTEASNKNTLTQQDLVTRRSPRKSIVMLYRENQRESARLRPLLTTKKLLKLGTWNVGTLYEAERTLQVVREMKNQRISLLGLRETRWLHSRQKKLSSGEVILYSLFLQDKPSKLLLAGNQ